MQAVVGREMMVDVSGMIPYAMQTPLILRFPMKLVPSLLLLASSVLSADPSFNTWSFTEKELFPSAIISTATVDWNGDEQVAEDKKESQGKDKLQKDELPIYGDENGWLGIDLADLPGDAAVEVEMSIDGFMKPSKWKGTIGKHDEEGYVRVLPKAAWDFEALMKVHQCVWGQMLEWKPGG
jgi:hypothetical protein